MEQLPLCLEKIILGYKKDMEQYDLDLKEWIFRESFRYVMPLEYFLDIGIYDYGMNDDEVFKTFKDFDYNYKDFEDMILFKKPIILIYEHFGNDSTIHCSQEDISMEDFVNMTEEIAIGDHIFLEEIEVLCEFKEIDGILHQVVMVEFGS